MSRLPIVDAKTMEKVLLRIARPLTREILREIDLTPDAFETLLRDL